MMTYISAISIFVKMIGNSNTGNPNIAMSIAVELPASFTDVAVVLACLRAGIFQGIESKRRGCHG